MRKFTAAAPYVFFAIQLLLPLANLCTAVAGWRIAPASNFAYMLVVLVVSLASIVLMRRDEMCEKRSALVRVLICLSLPPGLLNLVLLPSPGIAEGIVALLNIVCCIYAFFRCRLHAAIKTIVGVIAIPLMFMVCMFAVFMFLLQDFGITRITREIPSPEPGLKAVMVDSDQGALGGDTVVRAVKERVCGIPVGWAFSLEKNVYIGDWGRADSIRVIWKDSGTLVIDGIEYPLYN